MRIDVGIKRGGPIHEAIKEFAEDNDIRHFRAYAQLLRRGLEAEGYEPPEEDAETRAADD